MFLAGRFISGLGVGMMQVSVPIYQSELSPAKQRGLMVGGHGILIVCGYAMAAWTGLGCYFAAPMVQWRLCLSLQLVAPMLLRECSALSSISVTHHECRAFVLIISTVIGSPWLPESPRWLISKNKDQQGLEVLTKLHDTGDPNQIAAKEEFYQYVITSTS